MPAPTDAERALAILTLEHGLMEPAQAVKLISEARQGRRTVPQLLLDAKPIAELLAGLAAALGLRFYDLYSAERLYRIEPKLLDRFDINLLTRYAALPMLDKENKAVVALANPFDTQIRDYLSQVFGGPVPPMVLSPREQITNELVRYNAPATVRGLASEQGPTVASAAPPTVATLGPRNAVVDYVDVLLAQAVAERASDIHLEFTADQRMLLRLRIDGLLRMMAPPPPGREMEVLGVLLNRATMDATNQREPQDGTFSFEAAGRTIDARVAMLPQLNGPSLVIRLLDSQNLRTRLDDMGFAPEQLAIMRQALEAARGTILMSGPTGSGKTTTLYGLLREVDAVTRKVVTVEDPVEYRLPYISQTPIRPDMGERSLTFARALRTILRMDPDVILVGECRDPETAKTAMEAAITGHLVLTTIHAPSALGIYTRLIEMGIEPYLVADAVTLTVSQRLVRRVHECAILDPPTGEEMARLADLGVPVPERVPHIRGCIGCNATGYRGRLAVVEMFAPTSEVRSLVGQRRPVEDLVEAARGSGHFIDLVSDGMRHVIAGQTTVGEVIRVLESSEA